VTEKQIQKKKPQPKVSTFTIHAKKVAMKEHFSGHFFFGPHQHCAP
jgi:hypothetical protein